MNQHINFHKKTPSSDKINAFQDFEAVLQASQKAINSKPSAPEPIIRSLFVRKSLWAVAASICLLAAISVGLFVRQNKTTTSEVAYLVNQNDLDNAIRLELTDKNQLVMNLPIPQGTTSVLEENASPENASLEVVAQTLRNEMHCTLTPTPNTPTYISFVVSSEGEIQDLQAKGCEEQVKKALARFPKWKAGRLEGETLAQKVVVMI